MLNMFSVFHGFAATKATSKTARDWATRTIRGLSQFPAILPWPSRLSGCQTPGPAKRRPLPPQSSGALRFRWKMYTHAERGERRRDASPRPFGSIAEWIEIEGALT
jgi:hypothetical protein